MLEGIDFGRARTIVELGVGTGCVTRALLKRMRPDARLVSLELNEAFIQECSRIQDPRLTLRHECATRLPEILAEEGITCVDAVVSSLPLSLMEESVLDRILDTARDSLAPGGKFIQYQYSMNKQHRMLGRYPDVSVGFTLLNVPPAFVYECGREPEGGREPRIRPPRSFASLYAATIAAVAMVGRALQDL